jgi:riboflavin transporter FmnP
MNSMKDLKKLTIIFIRIQALSFVLMALFQWALLATSLLVISLKSVPSELANFEVSLASGIIFLLFGVILWARSRSLSNYFVASVSDEGNE